MFVGAIRAPHNFISDLFHEFIFAFSYYLNALNFCAHLKAFLTEAVHGIVRWILAA